MDVTVSSDSNAWLRPTYHRFAAQGGFPLLAESMHFERLIDAAADVSQKHAALMRQYNAETRRVLPGHLSKAESLRLGPAQVEL